MSGHTPDIASAGCFHKHAKPQVPDSAWRCPRCGKGPEDEPQGLVIEEGPNMDCSLTHEEDFLCCYACGFGTTGKAFAKAYARKVNLVTCAHCKGTGMVQAAKAEGK